MLDTSRTMMSLTLGSSQPASASTCSPPDAPTPCATCTGDTARAGVLSGVSVGALPGAGDTSRAGPASSAERSANMRDTSRVISPPLSLESSSPLESSPAAAAAPGAVAWPGRVGPASPDSPCSSSVLSLPSLSAASAKIHSAGRDAGASPTSPWLVPSDDNGGEVAASDGGLVSPAKDTRG